MKKIITWETANSLEKTPENELDIIISNYMLIARESRLTKEQLIKTAQMEVSHAMIMMQKDPEKYPPEQQEQRILLLDCLLDSLKYMNNKYEVEIWLN